MAGQPAMPAKRAKAVIPIMGEISTRRSGLGQRSVLQSVQRVLHGQGAAVGEAHEMDRLVGADPAARLLDREAGGGLPVLPVDVGQRRRDGAVRGQAGQEGKPAAVAVEPADVAAAVGGVGEPVQEDHRADGRAVRLQDVVRFQSSAKCPG